MFDLFFLAVGIPWSQFQSQLFLFHVLQRHNRIWERWAYKRKQKWTRNDIGLNFLGLSKIGNLRSMSSIIMKGTVYKPKNHFSRYATYFNHSWNYFTIWFLVFKRWSLISETFLREIWNTQRDNVCSRTCYILSIVFAHLFWSSIYLSAFGDVTNTTLGK